LINNRESIGTENIIESEYSLDKGSVEQYTTNIRPLTNVVICISLLDILVIEDVPKVGWGNAKRSGVEFRV
jgi:hypothetical protein